MKSVKKSNYLDFIALEPKALHGSIAVGVPATKTDEFVLVFNHNVFLHKTHNYNKKEVRRGLRDECSTLLGFLL